VFGLKLQEDLKRISPLLSQACRLENYRQQQQQLSDEHTIKAGNSILHSWQWCPAGRICVLSCSMWLKILFYEYVNIEIIFQNI